MKYTQADAEIAERSICMHQTKIKKIAATYAHLCLTQTDREQLYIEVLYDPLSDQYSEESVNSQLLTITLMIHVIGS